MKKEDLKDGMVVEVDDLTAENSNDKLYLVYNGKLHSIYDCGYECLASYDDDLMYVDDDISLYPQVGTWNIQKVFKVKDNSIGIIERFKGENLEIIWDRDNFTDIINWHKVPKGTKVIVTSVYGTETPAYFEEYEDNMLFHFVVCDSLKDDFTGYVPTPVRYRKCRLHPSVKPKVEWFD